MLNYIIFVTILLYNVDTKNINLEITKSDHIHTPSNIDCVHQIFEMYFKKSLIFLVNFNEIFLYPVVRIKTNNHLKMFVRKERPYGYIIDLRNDQPYYILKELDKSAIFNPRAIFIFILSDKSNLLLKLLDYYFIFKFVIISENKFYTVKHFDYIPIGDCLNASLVNDGINIITNKSPDIRNIQLKITYPLNPPMTICALCNNGTKGIEIDIANMIFNHIGNDYLYTRTYYTFWGEKINNSYEFSSIYGILQRHETDAVMGFFHSKLDEHFYFDQSFSYIQTHLNFIVPRAKKIPHWKRLLKMITPTVWSLYILEFFLVSFLIQFIKHISQMTGNNENLSISNIFTYLFQVVVDTVPLFRARTLTFRFISIFWLLQILIFNAALKSKLFSALIKTEYEKQIKTFEDIAYSNLNITLDTYLRNQFIERSTIAESIIYDRTTLVSYKSTIQTVTEAALDGNRAVMAFESRVKYNSQVLMNSNEEFSMYVVEKPAVNCLSIHVYFVRGHPLYDLYNKYLMNLFETGHVVERHHHTSMQYEINLKLANYDQQKISTKSLNINQLSAVFIIWILGIVISTLVFLYEHWTICAENSNKCNVLK